MSKRRFIQAVVVRSLPAADKVADAVRYGEALWDSLTAHGYGSERPEIRESRDYYRELNGRQKASFDAFWRAFAYKHERNGAARRWAQLGELSDGEYKQIIDAAGKEALRQREPGCARKMAEGWLFHKRYLDYQPETVSAPNAQQHVTARLSAELLGIKRLYEASQDEALLAQIKKLETAIKETRK